MPRSRSTRRRTPAAARIRLALTEVLESRQLLSVAQVGDVFVIAMENHNWTQPSTDLSPQQLKGNSAAPYINSLITSAVSDPNTSGVNPALSQTSYASNYLNAANGEHPSEPNYVWAEAGTNYNSETNFTINNDNDPSPANKNIFTHTPHLTSQLNDAGVSWQNYQEDYQVTENVKDPNGSPLISKSGTSTSIINPYYNTGQYNYAAKHDPMAFFTDTQTQNLNSFDVLRSDLAADAASNANPVSNFGRYNWITPNQYNDMHSSLNTDFSYNGTTYPHNTDQEAIAIGDHFLSQIVPQIMATKAYQDNGAIVIWMDETEGANRDNPAHTINEIVISGLAKPNITVNGVQQAYSSNVEMNHSSDIKSMEELFNLGGHLNNPLPPTEPYLGVTSNTVSGANDLSDLFQPGAISPTVLLLNQNGGKALTTTGGSTLTTNGGATVGVDTSSNSPTVDPINLPVPATDQLTATFSNTRIGGHASTVLNPGIYTGGITVSGKSKVTLNPGVYYIQDGGLNVSAGATLSGNGVLIVNAGSTSTDTIDISGGASVTLSAPSTLTGDLNAYNGITLLQNPTSHTAINVSGKSHLALTGIVYAPNAALTVSGGSSVNDTGVRGVDVILSDLSLTGGSSLTFDYLPQ